MINIYLQNMYWISQKKYIDIKSLMHEYISLWTEFSVCWLKKYSHNLKEESYFIWWECLGLWAQETASQ